MDVASNNTAVEMLNDVNHTITQTPAWTIDTMEKGSTLSHVYDKFWL